MGYITMIVALYRESLYVWFGFDIIENAP